MLFRVFKIRLLEGAVGVSQFLNSQLLEKVHFRLSVVFLYNFPFKQVNFSLLFCLNLNKVVCLVETVVKFRYNVPIALSVSYSRTLSRGRPSPLVRTKTFLCMERLE